MKLQQADFEEWAKLINDRDELAVELHKAYTNGFEDGKEYGWIEDWEVANLTSISKQLQEEEE